VEEVRTVYLKRLNQLMENEWIEKMLKDWDENG